MSNTKMIVLKFGGSVLHSPADFSRIKDEILRFVSDGYRVMAVVSAYYGVTEKLIADANFNKLAKNSHEFAELIASGEFQSASDLVSFLLQHEINACCKTPADLEFIATGDRASATPVSICATKIRESLDLTPVIVVPGFSAVDSHGHCVLLGRGGSDISAVSIAHSLGLTFVRLLKDVDGLYNKDPNKFEDALRLPYVDYETARQIGGELIQAEAIDFAAQKSIRINVASIGHPFGSQIGPKQTASEQGHHGQINQQVEESVSTT